MSKPARSAHLLRLAAALCLVLSPLSATALSALFDFDDFPGGVGPSDPLFNAPYTYLYRCDGKDYCTGQEAMDANTDGDAPPRKIATTRNGIAMEFSRGGSFYSVNFDSAGVLDTGDGSMSFTLFLLDFDTPLHSFQGDMSPPQMLGQDCVDDGHGGDVCTDVYALTNLYLWSDPGGQGTLVGSLTVAHGEPFDGTVSLVIDQPFRSARFGQAAPDNPTGFTWQNDYGIDNILVSTVPEPSTLLLMGFGLMALGVRSRSH